MKATPKSIRIEEEVRKENGKAEQLLRAKCNWEHMSRLAVIREWGDPRLWIEDGSELPNIRGGTQNLLNEIKAEQKHGRAKYGNGPDDFDHDDNTAEGVWHDCIHEHNERARLGTPIERRQHLVKVAGLAISAIQSFDRKTLGREEELDAEHGTWRHL
jgi:hypothetical protein